VSRAPPRRSVLRYASVVRLFAPCFAGAAIAVFASETGCAGERIVLGGDPSVDASAPPTFNAPELVAEVGAAGADDDKPTLTADQLELYFLSTRDGGPGGGDVWRSTRSSAGALWDSPSLVAEVSSESHEKSPAVSGDGLTLWLASDRAGGQGGLDVWVSTRPDRSSVWSTPVVVAPLNSSGDEIPRPPGQSDLVMPIGVRPASSSSSSSEYQIDFASRSAPAAGWTEPVPTPTSTAFSTPTGSCSTSRRTDNIPVIKTSSSQGARRSTARSPDSRPSPS
jgi:WD40-like Beta Propeller Repeat